VKGRRASIPDKKMIEEGIEDGGGTVALEELARDDGVCGEEEVEKGGGAEDTTFVLKMKKRLWSRKKAPKTILSLARKLI